MKQHLFNSLTVSRLALSKTEHSLVTEIFFDVVETSGFSVTQVYKPKQGCNMRLDGTEEEFKEILDLTKELYHTQRFNNFIQGR